MYKQDLSHRMEAAVAEEKHAVRVQCEGCSALLEVRLAHGHSLKRRVLYLRGRLPRFNNKAVVDDQTISPSAGGAKAGMPCRRCAPHKVALIEAKYTML